MAEPILIMGKSGTGKSTSLRNLPPEQTIILSPNAKSLPFPGSAKNYVRGKNFFVNNQMMGGSDDPKNELEKMDLKLFIRTVAEQATKVRYLVLEDFTHYFSARIFSKNFLNQNSGNAAFQRWNQFGADVYDTIFKDLQNLRPDLYLILLHHTALNDEGYHAFKSPGKLLDSTIDVPSYFTYIFHSLTIDAETGTQYVFQTNKNSIYHAKTPFGCFEQLHVPNDAKAVLDKIDAYTGMGAPAPAATPAQ